MLNPATFGVIEVGPEIVAALSAGAAVGATAMALRGGRKARRAERNADVDDHPDLISGLPNRSHLREWLRSDIARASGQTTDLGLLLVDLCRFQSVNDMFGREVGDQLMREVAERIGSVLGPTDRLARYGGDEFALVAGGITGSNGLANHARRLIRLIEAPYCISGQTIRISASVGAALAGRTSSTAEDLIHHADVARYQATAKGDGQVVIYEAAMSSALTPANAEQLVNEALRSDSFVLQYQPVVDLVSGRIIGAEALLRWRTADRGTLGPDEFVPVLEETGLIVPVGAWVLQQACLEAARLRHLLPAQPLPTVTINVSARQLSQADFADTVAGALRDSGASERQIHLEITEGALMHDVGSAWAILRQVKAMGVKLALDDFGTGYSSLSYVRRFSLDMLKIDKSFIDGIDASPEDRAIVEHVIGLADALGMTTVAEGVERPEQLLWLRRLGCRMAQGFALSRPLSAEDFESLVVRRNDHPFRFDGELPASTPVPPAAPTPPPPPPAVDGPILDLLVPPRSNPRPQGQTPRQAPPHAAPHPDSPPPMIFAEPTPAEGDEAEGITDDRGRAHHGISGVDVDLVAVEAEQRTVTSRMGLPRFREYRSPAGGEDEG